MARHIDFTQYPKPIELAAYAIGLDHKRPYIRHGKFFYRPYRNYFTAADNTHAFHVWKELCEKGYARFRQGNSAASHDYKHGTFWLTRAGLDWLSKALGITIFDEED